MSVTELKSILSLNFGNSCSHGFRGGWRSRQFSCCHGRWSRPRRQMRKAEALSYDAMLDTPPRAPSEGEGPEGRPRPELRSSLQTKRGGGREGASEMTATAMKMSLLHSAPPLPCPSSPLEVDETDLGCAAAAAAAAVVTANHIIVPCVCTVQM